MFIIFTYNEVIMDELTALKQMCAQILSCYDYANPENNAYFQWIQQKRQAGVTHPEDIAFPRYIYELVSANYKG
jgi:hypothetical protein